MPSSYVGSDHCLEYSIGPPRVSIVENASSYFLYGEKDILKFPNGRKSRNNRKGLEVDKWSGIMGVGSGQEGVASQGRMMGEVEFRPRPPLCNDDVGESFLSTSPTPSALMGQGRRQEVRRLKTYDIICLPLVYPPPPWQRTTDYTSIWESSTNIDGHGETICTATVAQP